MPGSAAQPDGFSTAAEKVRPSKYGKIRASFMNVGAFFNVGVSSMSPISMGGSMSGRSFQDRFARKLAVVVGARGLFPGFDLEMLILERVGQLVAHDSALVVDRNPVGNVDFVCFWVVQTGHLIG